MTALDPRPLVSPVRLAAPPPRQGFWLVRARLGRTANKQVSWGPMSPARIVLVQTRFEPGEVDNVMERSPHLGAFVAGEPVSPYALFPDTWHWHEQDRIFRVERAITSGEYAKLMAAIDAARRADRYLPAAVPFKQVDQRQVEIPFGRKP